MDTQNLTLRLPKPLLKRAKQVAAQRETTVTNLVIEGLTRVTVGEEPYQKAWERQKAWMREDRHLRAPGGPLPDREAAHERSV